MISNKRSIQIAFVVLFFAITGLTVADVPFYYAGATAADPQIKSLVVGVNETVGQAVVSHDRKYVTLDVDPQLSASLGVRSFTYQKPGLGFVGSAAASSSGPPGTISGSIQASPNQNGLTPSIAALPSEINPVRSPLEKPGISFIRALP